MTDPARVAGVLAGAVALAALPAVGFDVTPSLGLGLGYTDNVLLAPESQEQEEFVTEFNPGLALLHDSARLRTDLLYSLRHLRYTNGSAQDQTFHQLDAHANSVLVRELLFLNADVTATQQNIDPDRRASFRHLAASGNLTDVITASISPELRHRFGQFADGSLRYQHGRVNFDEDVSRPGISTEDRSLDNLQTQFGNERRRYTWLLTSDARRIDYDPEVDEFARHGALVGYRFTPTLHVSVGGGREDYEFGRSAFATDPSGGYWEGTAEWEPGPRSRFSARYGDHGFGDAFRLEAQTGGKDVTLTATYTQDLSTQTDLLFLRQLDITTGVVSDGLALVADAFVRKRGDVQLNWDTARTTVTLVVYREQRDFDNALTRNERASGASVNVAYRLGAYTDFVAGVQGVRHQRLDAVGAEDTLLESSLGVNHRLGTSTRGDMRAYRTDRHAEFDGDDAVEHSVVLQITKEF